MGEPFIGSEAVAAGVVSHSQLRRKYTRVCRDVYVSEGTELTHAVRARAAWLWSRRRGVIAGFSAAGLYGSEWVDATRPVDIIHDNRHALPGLQIWGDRPEADEFELIDGVAVTTPARTALDLACWYPSTTAVAAIDALTRVTDVKMADAELVAARYRDVVDSSVHASRSISSTRVPNLRRRHGCAWFWCRPVCHGRRPRFRW